MKFRLTIVETPCNLNAAQFCRGSGGFICTRICDSEPEPSVRRCANVDGFSIHANVSQPAHRRQKLENLCRYMLRPPLAVERFGVSGRLPYRMTREKPEGLRWIHITHALPHSVHEEHRTCFR